MRIRCARGLAANLQASGGESVVEPGAVVEGALVVVLLGAVVVLLGLEPPDEEEPPPPPSDLGALSGRSS